MKKGSKTLLIAAVAMLFCWRCFDCKAERKTNHHQSSAGSQMLSAARLVEKPSPFIRRALGSTLVVSCQAAGSPKPNVTWYKDGRRIESNESNSIEEDRLSLLNSGYLVLTEIQFSDAGSYICHTSNSAGEDMAKMELVVSDGDSSGCSDGTTDGLIGYDDIQACRGRWKGHVKSGRNLCSAGWRVCSPRDAPSLSMLSWTDVTHLNGCYAYNAANYFHQCTRCHGENMAGIGSQCRRRQRNHPATCLSVGRVDVFPSAIDNGCEFVENITSGVLCCKKPETTNAGGGGGGGVGEGGKHGRGGKKCHPRCANGGTCFPDNRCRCLSGFKGASCQIAVCKGGCVPNATCVSPGQCRCNPGHSGPKCRKKSAHRQMTNICTIRPCLNGGRCQHGKCKCTPLHYGQFCQKDRKLNETRRLNSTE